MALDLGTLFATIDADDTGFSQKISRAKTDLQDLKRAADSAGRVKLDVAPTGTREVDNASRATERLDQSRQKAGGQNVDVAPTGTGELDRATDSAMGLGESLDAAGSKAPDVAPAGANELDSAGVSAADLDAALDAVDAPDVTPAGTGAVTDAAQQAGALDSNLQAAGASGQSLTVSTQPADELGRADSAAGGLVDKIGEITTGALTKTVKWGAITSATAAIGGLGATLTRGFGRLASIDEAEAQLRGLGRSAEEIDSIIDTVDRSLQGTSFLVEDAARSAAVFSTQGVDAGRDMERMMSLLADTTAQANSNFSEMTPIFSQIIARGGLTTQTFDQLNDRATGVGEALSEHLGVSLEEVREQANDITFEEFAAAMEANIGGAAQQTGETVRGAWDNVGAAFGRLGAALAKPVFEAAPGVLGSITDKVDEWTEAAGPLVEEWVEKLGPGLSDFAQNIGPQVSGALTTIKDTAGLVTPAISGIGSVLSSIPMEAYVAMLGMAVAKHKGLTAALSSGTGVMRGWGRDVRVTQTALQAQGREIGVVSSAMLTMQNRIPAIGRMGAAYRESSTDLRLAGMTSRETARQMTGLQRVTGTARGSMQSFGGVLAGTVHSGFSLATTGAKGLLTALGGPWGLAIGGATAAIMGLISKHQEAAAEVAAHEQAQRALKDSLDDTTGSITDQTRELQIKALEEAGVRETGTKLGMSEGLMARASTGDAQAEAEFDSRVGGAIKRSSTNSIEDSDFWQNYGSAFENQGFTAEDYAAAMDQYDQTGSYGDAYNDARHAAQNAGDLQRGNDISGLERDMRNDAREASEAYRELRTEVRGLGEDYSQVEADAAAERINKFTEESQKAADAAELLSDHTMKLGEDATEVSVKMDETEYQKVKDQLDEIDDAHTFEDGVLTLSMPSGAGILEMLDQIDGKVAHFEDGRIDIESTAPEVQDQLIELGMAVEDLDENGNRVGIHIEDDVQDTLERLRDINAFEIDPKTGELTINDNLAEIQAWLDGLDGTEITGELKIDDNADSVIHNLGLVEVEAEKDKHGNVIITDTTDENMDRLHALGVEVGTDKHGNVIITDNASEVATNVKNTLNSPNGDTSSRHTVRREFIDASLTPGGSMTRFADENFGGRASGGRIPRNAQGSRIPRSANGDRHAGYRLPTSGPGTGVTDGILGMNPQGIPVSWVDAGEWIINGDSSEEWDGTLAAINGGRPSQIVAAMLADLEAHANGGRTSDRVKSELSPYNGTPYVFGGWGPGGTDCSGAVSMGVNSYLGRDPLESRTGTGNMEAWLSERGFQQGRGGPNDVVVGWLNGGPGGGHTAMQLDDGTFIESGGNTGGGLTIGGPAGPLDGRGFTNFMFLPGDGGEAEGGYDERGSYSAYSSTAGGSSGGGGSSVSKSVNGGAGPLLKDGSVLEAAAAAYSQQTGQPMPDDVVSWGNVLGLGTTFEGENLETEQRRHEREMRAHDRNIAATERDLEQAKKDVGEKEKALAEAKPEDKEQAQWELDDARDKVADLSDKLIDMRDETVELRKTNEQLKVAVEKQKAAPQSAGQAFGITAMADGGILGAARDAQINEGSATLWAEAGPEAYIPLSRNKRARSLDLWAETGKRLGVDVLSMANLIGSGLPGLMEGRLQFSSGDTTSLDRLGLNMDAAKHAGGREIGSAVGAVFNGPVTVNDPRQYLQGQLNTASRQINKAMKSRML